MTLNGAARTSATSRRSRLVAERNKIRAGGIRGHVKFQQHHIPDSRGLAWPIGKPMMMPTRPVPAWFVFKML